MKNVFKLFAAFLVLGLFIASFGGDTCEICTMEGQEDQEICQEDSEADSTFTARIAGLEAIGYSCEE